MRTARIRSVWKNMCSVRHSPMPCAPKLRASSASAGVSALARIFSRRTPSAQRISVSKSWPSSGDTVGTRPLNTKPVEPSSVITSPSRNSMPPSCTSFSS